MLLGFSNTPDEQRGMRLTGDYVALGNAYNQQFQYGNDAGTTGSTSDMAIPNVWVPYVLGYDKGIRTTATTKLTESPFSTAFKAVKWSRDIHRMAWVFELVKAERVLNDAKGDTGYLSNYVDEYPSTWPNGDASDYSTKPSFADGGDLGVPRPAWRNFATWATFEDMVIAGRSGTRLHIYWVTDVRLERYSLQPYNSTGVTGATGHMDSEGTLSDPFEALTDASNRQLWDVSFSVTLETQPFQLSFDA
jgi:hypothetical protein